MTQEYRPMALTSVARCPDDLKRPFFKHPLPCVSYTEKDFILKYVVDLRWGKYEWQAREAHKESKKKPRFKVCRYPRRHGKTHYFIHDMRDYLLTVKKDNPNTCLLYTSPSPRD